MDAPQIEPTIPESPESELTALAADAINSNGRVAVGFNVASVFLAFRSARPERPRKARKDLRRSCLTRSRCSSVAVLTLIVNFICGCSSSGPGPNATPIISTISPGDITAGSDSFTLFISGTGFSKSSVGFLDGTSRPTTLNNSTSQLEMTIAAADVANANSSVQITVVNPDPGGRSNALTFVVNPVPNGAPAITSFTPPSATAGTMGPFTVSIAGTNFASTAVANWNGSPRETTFVSSSQIMVNFTTEDLAAQGFGSVSVANPAPGGGVSPSKDFPVN